MIFVNVPHSSGLCLFFSGQSGRTSVRRRHSGKYVDQFGMCSPETIEQSECIFCTQFKFAYASQIGVRIGVALHSGDA
jgi:hypothetical protein